MRMVSKIGGLHVHCHVQACAFFIFTFAKGECLIRKAICVVDEICLNSGLT